MQEEVFDPVPPVPGAPTPEDDDEDERRELVSVRQPLGLRLSAATAVPRRYAVTLIGAGLFKGHRVRLSAEVLGRDWAVFAKPNLTALADHPDFLSTPKIDRVLGTYTHVRLDGERLCAELELAPTRIAAELQPLFDLVATQPERAPNIGLSANVWCTLGEPGDDGVRLIERLVAVDSVDVVFDPASEPARFVQILAQKGQFPMPDVVVTPVAGAPPGPEPQDYLARLADATLTLALREANLPDACETAIRAEFAGRTPSASQIDAAIQQQRTLISQLSFAISGHDTPLDGGRVSRMRTSLDEAQDVVNWMFGVAGAATPPPSLRSPAAIYGALTGDYNWHGRFTPQQLLFANANTSTLADLAANAMNKIVAITWASLGEYRWFEPLVTVQPHDGSTHDMSWISFGGIANLPAVAQGGAYTELTVGDSKEVDSFAKYGGYVGITEEMLRKSELAKIQAVPKALAIAAVRTRSAAIAALFTANAGVGPTLDDDATALFHANHGSNVQTTAFSKSAWAAARLECYKQTELGSSKRMGFWPKFFLGPADLYDTALEVFGYGAGPGGWVTGENSTVSNVNAYAESRPGDPRPMVISVPDWTDANDWAYLCDPNLVPVIQMSYAQAPRGGGHPTPEIYSASNPSAGLLFEKDVLPVKVRDWFAYGVSGWRGIGKRNVT